MEAQLDQPAVEPRGITPTKWGAAAWTFIHYVAAGYPKHPTSQDADEYRRFFSGLGYVLPCQACRNHLHEHMRNNPPDAALAAGRDDLFAWTVRLHNVVNETLGKTRVSPESMAHWYAQSRLVVAPASYRVLDALGGAVLALVVALALTLIVFAYKSLSRRGPRRAR